MSPKSRIRPVKPQWEGECFDKYRVRPTTSNHIYIYISLSLLKFLIHLYRLRVGGLFSVILI